MGKHTERRVALDGAPNVTLSPGWGYTRGELIYYRTLRNGNSEEVTLTFPVDLSDLRCIAESVGKTIVDLENKLNQIREAAGGES